MLRQKRVLCLVLSLVVVFSLIGCSQTTEKPQANEGTDKAGTSVKAETSAKAAEPVDLLFWEMMWGPSDVWTAGVEKQVAKFNEEHPNINVKVQLLPWDNYYQQFLTAVTTESAPDVSTGAFQQSIQYAAMDKVLDLSSIVDEWKADGTYDDFLKGSIELHQYKGIQAGIPWTCDPRFITYRKDIFEQAGIKKMPTSWDEFLDICRQIKNKTGITPFAIPGGDQNSSTTLMQTMFSNGIGICDANGQSTFSDPKVVESLKFYDTLYKEGLISKGCASYKANDLLTLLQNGKTAMILLGMPGQIYYGDPKVGKLLGVMPTFASKTGGEAHGLNWVNPIVAYKQTEHPEECKTFIKWWVENSLSLFTEAGAVTYPVRGSFLKNDFYLKDPMLNEITNNVIPYCVTPVWPTANLYPAFSQIDGEKYVGMALQEVLIGNDDLQGIADKQNAMISKAIKDMTEVDK